MQLDQNNPGLWMALGVVFMLLGVIAGSLADNAGFGRFIVGAGALLLIVGLIMFAVRAGTNRTD